MGLLVGDRALENEGVVDIEATSVPDREHFRGSPTRVRLLSRLVVGVGILVLAILPLIMGAYPIGLASRMLAFALLVVSVDLLTGFTGMPTLGQVAYFGAGAYTAGLMGIHVTGNAFVQVVAGTLAAAVLALVTGSVVVRTTGIVFLMVTLAVGELAYEVFGSLSVVGASDGLGGIPPLTLLPGGATLDLAGFVYWWILVVFLVGVAAAVCVVKSPLGRSMRGVRDAETRLHALGQQTYSVRLLAYVIAGGIAGAAGTAWVAQARFFSPADLGFTVSAFALLSVVLGGAGTLWGPMLGAAVVVFIQEYVASFTLFEGRSGILLGTVFVLCVFLLPRGIAGVTARSLWTSRKVSP